jgi:hypothetical protein
VIEVEAMPGQVIEKSVTVSNEGDSLIDLRAYARDRRVQPGGQLVFLPPGNPVDSAATWLTIDPAEVTLQTGKEAVVRWKVSVPQQASPGDHVAVIFFEDAPKTQGGGLVIGSRVGVVIPVHVVGNTVMSGKLSSFRCPPVPIQLRLVLFGKKLLWRTWVPAFPITERGPLKFEAGIENTGNVRLAVGGKVEIRDVFGRTVTTIETPEPINIYPRDNGSLTLTLEQVPLIGRFVALGRFRLGDQEVTARTVFYTFPTRKAAGVALLLLAGLIFVGLRRRGRRVTPSETAGQSQPSPAPSSPPPSPPSSSPGGVPTRRERKKQR